MTTIYFLKNPRLLMVVVFSILVAGVGSYLQLPRMEDPVLRKRVGVITTVYPGGTAQQMESLIAIPIERELESISEVATVRSNCRANSVNVVLELSDHVNDVDEVWALIRTRMTKVGSQLPSGCEQPDLEVFPLKAFASIIAVRSRRQELESLRNIADKLKSRIYTISGTESVSLFGYTPREIAVDVPLEELLENGLSVGQISQELSRALTGESVGILDRANNRFQITVAESQASEQRIKEISVRNARGELVKIGDLGTVALRPQKEGKEKCLVDSRESLVIAAMVEDRARIDFWASDLREELRAIREANPDIEFEEIFSQQEHVSRRMTRLYRNLLLSATSVMAVVLLLMGWKSMLVVVIALPLTVLIVLVGMRLLSVPIHQMSVTGIIVSLGLLIDNAIVVVEEIRKKIFCGVSPSRAVLDSIHHLRFPLIGATVTTALSFLPIALMPGAAGEFVGSIAITVILAVVSSYFVAILLLPALMGSIGISPETKSLFSYGVRYRPASELFFRSLVFVIKRPWMGLAFGVFLPAIGFLAWMHLPLQFFPPSDRQQVQVEIEIDSGSSFAALESSVEEVQRLISQDERISQQAWFLGKSAATFYYNVVPRRRNSPYYAQAFLTLADNDRDETAEQIVRQLQTKLERIENARVTVRLLEQGPPFDSPIEIKVSGPERAELLRIGNKIRQVVAAAPGVIQTRCDLDSSLLGYQFSPNLQSLNDSAVSTNDVVDSIRSAIHGIHTVDIVRNDELVPVRVGVDLGETHQLPDVLLDLPLRTSPRSSRSSAPTQNQNVGMYGEFQVQSQPATILRLDGNRVNEIRGYLQVGFLPSSVLDAIRKGIDELDLQMPDGYRVEFGGENERRSNATSNLFALVPVFLMLMLALIVTIFGTFEAGMMIALIAGLTVGLVPLSLAAFGYPFGFMAIVGAMGLIGIAINDSIVVMASLYALSRDESVEAEAVAKSVFDNTRHIIATTLTTIAGFLPLVIGQGRFWPPMAIVLSGGILGATLLAIYFVPSFFVICRRLKIRMFSLESQEYIASDEIRV